MNPLHELRLHRADPSRAADLLLACACVRGDGAALEAFDRLVVRRVVPALKRIDRRPEVIDEATRLTCTSLLLPTGGRPARLSDYRGDAPLWLWVKCVAIRLMVDLARPDASLSEFRLSSSALALLQLHERHRPVMNRALARALSTLSARERSLLKLAFDDGLSIGRIAVVYGIHRDSAASWVGAARQRLATTLHRFVSADLDLSPVEFDAFMNALGLRLDSSHRAVER